MKVLNVIDGTGWCGTKEQTYLISTYLKRVGIDSELALAENHIEMIEKVNGKIKLHFYGVHKGGSSRFNIKNLRKLKKIIETGQHDIIVAHSSHAYDYVRFVFPFLQKKPKVVALRRSGYVPGFLSKHLKYRLADKIVVVSKQVAELLVKRNFFPEKIEVIESGIELERFKPVENLRIAIREKLGVKDNEYMFVNVANWQPWRKGQEVILKALKELPFRNYRMFFVGLNTDSKEAKEAFKKYGLENRCIGLGFRNDVHEILQGADLFIFGSYSEGIAGAVLQAMATGNVVVSTNAGGIPEYLEDGINGFIVKVGDYISLREKIVTALNLPHSLKRTITENAIKTAQRYSIENTVNKYIKLFEELQNK